MQLPEKRLLKNKYVAISGAGGGLGKAFAVECASRGWDLFLTDFALEPLENLATGLRNSYGVDVVTHPCDLTDPSSRIELFEYVRKMSLGLWMLINVAGTDYEGPFFEQTSQDIRTIIRLNIEGTLEVTHAFLRHRDPLSAFHIINVASLAAYYPMPVKATYAASKRFLLDFSLALRQEVRDLGITVTALCPAGMPTTPECIRAIEAQGLAGHITTMDTGRVASQTLDAALAGRAVVIPGRMNRILKVLGTLMPTPLVVSLIRRRWKSAQLKRSAQLPSLATEFV